MNQTMKDAPPLIVTTPSDVELVIAREFNAPRTLVFEAWTNPDLIKRWMLGPEGWSMPVCELDLRPGGKWRFVWRRANGDEIALHGVYKEVDPPVRIVNTENWGGPYPETLNTLVLEERDGRTTATTTVKYPSKAARDAATKTGMTDGVAKSYQRLDEALEMVLGT